MGRVVEDIGHAGVQASSGGDLLAEVEGADEVRVKPLGQVAFRPFELAAPL